MNRLRLFTAAALPFRTASEIEMLAEAFSRGLPPQALRRVRPENYHITLQFLGDTDAASVPAIAARIDAAVASLATSAPLELLLEAIGAFPNARRPRTVWVGIGDPSGRLVHFARALGRQLNEAGFEFDRRDLRPHVTIGYVKRQAGKEGVRSIAASLAGQDRSIEHAFACREIGLVSSVTGPGGSRYETLHTAVLETRP
jgi:2'-5' RNA ligase